MKKGKKCIKREGEKKKANDDSLLIKISKESKLPRILKSTAQSKIKLNAKEPLIADDGDRR